MVDIDKAVVARYKKGNKIFEILVDCDMALALRQNKNIDRRKKEAGNIFKNHFQANDHSG